MGEDNQNEDKKEIISNIEPVKRAHYGGSDFLRVPKNWESIKDVKKPLIDWRFDAYVEKDQNGAIYFVFKRIRDVGP